MDEVRLICPGCKSKFYEVNLESMPPKREAHCPNRCVELDWFKRTDPTIHVTQQEINNLFYNRSGSIATSPVVLSTGNIVRAVPQVDEIWVDHDGKDWQIRAIADCNNENLVVIIPVNQEWRCKAIPAPEFMGTIWVPHLRGYVFRFMHNVI